MINRTQIRQFLALVDAGNFTLASRRINVAQPTLSMGIAELEKRLGTPLFIRERRRIRLTEAGNRFLPYARSIEREFRLAESMVTAIPVPVRPIRLGVIQSFATDDLEAVMNAYGGEEPVELVEGTGRELARAVASGGLDLAVTILPDDGKERDTVPLYTEPYLVALPAGHRLAKSHLLSADQLAGETMIARRSCELLAQTSRFFTDKGVRPPFSLRSANEDRAMAMVRAGIGVTVAPRSLSRPGIAMVPLDSFDFTRTVGLLLNSDWQAHYGKDHPLLDTFANTLQGPAHDAMQ